MNEVTANMASDYWDSIVDYDYDYILENIGLLESNEMNFNVRTKDSLKMAGVKYYNSLLPQIREVVCDSDIAKSISDATAKDVILTIAPLIGQGIPTALAIAVAAIAIKQTLLKICGQPLKG